MATRSTIAILNEDGTVSQIYCHWDGYLDGVGTELIESYNSRELVNALMIEGDHSTIAGGAESYRSRGESNIDAMIYSSIDDYFWNSYREDYNYLFVDDEWFLLKLRRTLTRVEDAFNLLGEEE